MALPSLALAAERDLVDGVLTPRHEVVAGTLVAHEAKDFLAVQPWGGDPVWDCDVVVLQRWMNDDLPERILRARAAGQVVIQDLDDWWEGLDPSNLAFWASSPSASPTSNRDHYRRSIAASDLITASTPFLADRYRRLGRTILVRNAIDLDRWTFEPSEAETVGWIGAVPWRSSGDLRTLRGILGPFLDRHGWTAVHGGHIPSAEEQPDRSEVMTVAEWEQAQRRELAKPSEDEKPEERSFASETGVDPALVELRTMAPIAEYPALFRGIGVLVVPLADSPFNEAKSCVRGLEAAAAGVPFVASATPEYRWLAEEHGVGRIARRPRDWVRLLERFADPEERAIEAKRNRENVSALGLGSLRVAWDGVLTEVSRGAPGRLSSIGPDFVRRPRGI